MLYLVAMPPLGIGDTVICMGAGITAGIGFDKVNKMADRNKKVFDLWEILPSSIQV